jgi:AcrR family transcriptional regulator
MSTGKLETRARILEAARRLLLDHGYHGVGIAEVGKAAGVSRQTVYQHHFRSKSELLLALVRHIEETQKLAELFQPVGAAATASEALMELVAASTEVDARVHDIARILDGARTTDAAAEAAWQDRMALRRSGARLVVGRLASEGRLAPGWTVESATDFIWHLFSPATYQFLVIERGWSRRRLVERLRAVLAASLLRTPPDSAGDG